MSIEFKNVDVEAEPKRVQKAQAKKSIGKS